MKLLPSLLLCLLALITQPAVAAQVMLHADEGKVCRAGSNKKVCDVTSAGYTSEEVTCKPEMRGRCGKRKGDWYGARQPVANEAEARTLLLNYFAAQGYTVSELAERRWGFRADVLNKDGKIVDRVMIDKRSGRIRSLY